VNALGLPESRGNPQTNSGFVIDKKSKVSHNERRRGVVPYARIVKTKVFLPVQQAHTGSACQALNKTFDSPADAGMLDRSSQQDSSSVWYVGIADLRF
jgi:hypothetical protein